jgi:transcriptional regulator with XRE-family HTH domain
MAIKSSKKTLQPLDEYQSHYKKIGSRLKQLRLKAGYSAADKFAYEHDVHPAQYTRYERGVDMRISSLIKILAIHKLTLQEFFKGVS